MSYNHTWNTAEFVCPGLGFGWVLDFLLEKVLLKKLLFIFWLLSVLTCYMFDVGRWDNFLLYSVPLLPWSILFYFEKTVLDILPVQILPGHELYWSEDAM